MKKLFSKTVYKVRIFSKFIYCFILILEKLFGNIDYKIRIGLAKGFKRNLYYGFKIGLRPNKDELFLQKIVFKKGIVVYDIGGYVGVYSLFFSQVVSPTGKVITFEPNPINYNEIKRNLLINNVKNVSVLSIGIGSKKDVLEFVVNPIFQSRGTFSREVQKEYKRKSISDSFLVNVNTIDNLIRNNNIPEPNFVKIDVEGYETEVIIGMKNTIERYKPALYIEIHSLVETDLLSILENNDYSIYHIEGNCFLNQTNYGKIKDGHVYCVVNR